MKEITCGLFYIILMFLLISSFSMIIELKKTSDSIEQFKTSPEKTEYKVYYEYNLYNNDTIPIDTIYYRIK